MDFKDFGIHTFRVYLNFLLWCCFLVSIPNPFTLNPDHPTRILEAVHMEVSWPG